jgi:hypothetical protein
LNAFTKQLFPYEPSKERDDAVRKAQALLKQKPVYLDSETTGLESVLKMVE